MEEDRLMESMLLDFYGELLTDRQRMCCEMHYNDDLSLSEIAEECGISRQGVWDNIRRGDAIMRETEEKTGLIRRFSRFTDAIESIESLADTLLDSTDGKAHEAAEKIKRVVVELRSQE